MSVARRSPREARVLVVEDTPANLRLVSLLLRNAGYEVLPARSAEEGIAVAFQQRPDLILMDITLPGMDGIEAMRVLKANELTRGIPIVALTALAMQGDERRIRQAGCDGYIAKPIRYKPFLEEVARFLAA